MNDSPSSPDDWTEDPSWYRDAIIYQLHVKAFGDADGDGMGDFAGLIQHLDYVQELGVNTIWLLPFYPSPLRDDGYDIADYCGVHPDYGTLRQFRAFVREAHRRGLRVITELVINHTSDQHPWFQAARSARPGSAKRDFYVWSDSDQKYQGTRIIFTDTETSNWAWDPVAKAYYWHRFFSHQPDLNFDNPRVFQAVVRVMRFWFDAGVDGMRLDAIPYLCEREGTNNENLPETHRVLKRLRAEMDARYRDRLFLAEANQWPEDVAEYFGDGDECQMAFHFPLMPRMYMAVAQEDRHPIVEIMEQTPDLPDGCQWAVFLRNHDELTLEMVTDRERDYLYATYAADPRMRVNVGIRRRLAPLLDNDLERLRLMNSLLMSMPGSPIIYYGDEIGMGDNIYLGDRNSVRTPMQWSPDRNAGFSRADPQKLYLPPVMDPVYGYEAVNVEAQRRDPSSLLNWMKRLIAVRKSHTAFGRGGLRFLYPRNRKILAYLREHGDQTLLCVVNLGRSPQPVELDLSEFRGCVPVEAFGHTPFPPIGELPYLLTLTGHGFYWFVLSREASAPSWHEDLLVEAPLHTVAMFAGFDSLFPDRHQGTLRAMAVRLLRQLETRVLPEFLGLQRWYAGKDGAASTLRLRPHGCWGRGGRQWLFADLEAQAAGQSPQQYALPLALDWQSEAPAALPGRAHIVAQARDRARLGILYDAFADSEFCVALVNAMAAGERAVLETGTLEFSATRALLDRLADTPLTAEQVRRPGAIGSNSIRVLDERMFLKGYRRLRPGTNPELEMGRFLTETVLFGQTVPLLGALELVCEDGSRVTLALLQAYLDNQGDAWEFTLEHLKKALEEAHLLPELGAAEFIERQGGYLLLVQTLASRTGELHLALATPSDDPAFLPEPWTAGDLTAWRQRLQAEAEAGLDLLAAQAQAGPEAESLLAARERLLAAIERLVPETLELQKIRCHGDYHLGQALVVNNDFILVDFEGEPGRDFAERRCKESPLKDVAGMLRSFDYVAAMAVDAVSRDRPDDRDRLGALADAWRAAVGDTFLEGYARQVAGGAFWPADADIAHTLVDLFALEKAFYELRYEFGNRPQWIPVPIRGLVQLCERLAPAADGETET